MNENPFVFIQRQIEARGRFNTLSSKMSKDWTSSSSSLDLLAYMQAARSLSRLKILFTFA
jgi:hypothetical protein